jgi:hypothetical protein
MYSGYGLDEYALAQIEESAVTALHFSAAFEGLFAGNGGQLLHVHAASCGSQRLQQWPGCCSRLRSCRTARPLGGPRPWAVYPSHKSLLTVICAFGPIPLRLAPGTETGRLHTLQCPSLEHYAQWQAHPPGASVLEIHGLDDVVLSLSHYRCRLAAQPPGP